MWKSEKLTVCIIGLLWVPQQVKCCGQSVSSTLDQASYKKYARNAHSGKDLLHFRGPRKRAKMFLHSPLEFDTFTFSCWQCTHYEQKKIFKNFPISKPEEIKLQVDNFQKVSKTCQNSQKACIFSSNLQANEPNHCTLNFSNQVEKLRDASVIWIIFLNIRVQSKVQRCQRSQHYDALTICIQQ